MKKMNPVRFLNPSSGFGIPKPKKGDNRYLDIAEAFYNVVQGEGPTVGRPSVFLRMQNCTLNCEWCDTEWKKGSRISFDSLFKMFEYHRIIDRLHIQEQHLILTGGSPLLQQQRLAMFLQEFAEKYKFSPIIEVENEMTLIPIHEFSQWVTQWNNSPKLSNSGMKEEHRLKENVFTWFWRKQQNAGAEVYYKFVISNVSDIEEINWIVSNFNIDPRRIILMPLGDTVEELNRRRKIVLELALFYGFLYSDRLQIIANIL